MGVCVSVCVCLCVERLIWRNRCLGLLFGKIASLTETVEKQNCLFQLLCYSLIPLACYVVLVACYCLFFVL